MRILRAFREGPTRPPVADMMVMPREACLLQVLERGNLSVIGGVLEHIGELREFACL